MPKTKTVATPRVIEPPALPEYIEQMKETCEQHFREYEAMVNAYEIWLQAWRARQRGFQGYEQPEMCEALDD